MQKKYDIVHMDEIDPVECPCGFTRRAFTTDIDRIASIHMVDIKKDSKVHYHKKLTEIYFILEGQGFMELDGNDIAVTKHSAVLIKPGCRHRAKGEMKIVNIPVPAFDPEDEWFD